jgi:hypothetical protein
MTSIHDTAPAALANDVLSFLKGNNRDSKGIEIKDGGSLLTYGDKEVYIGNNVAHFSFTEQEPIIEISWYANGVIATKYTSDEAIVWSPSGQIRHMERVKDYEYESWYENGKPSQKFSSSTGLMRWYPNGQLRHHKHDNYEQFWDMDGNPVNVEFKPTLKDIYDYYSQFVRTYGVKELEFESDDVYNQFLQVLKAIDLRVRDKILLAFYKKHIPIDHSENYNPPTTTSLYYPGGFSYVPIVTKKDNDMLISLALTHETSK